MTSESRKTVTVVFVDVSGSTALGERLDPEALRRVMGRYFEEMRTALERHGGTVEKFIGDAVVAVFGIPELHEDDALRAVRAAAEMRETLARLNDELERERGVRLQVRTGVNTGEVAAGDSAGGEFFATGDAVNVAARLEQAAGLGEILLGEETRRLVRGAVELEPVEPLSLKGKADQVPAYRLLALREGAPAFARRFDTPFVGRRAELATLLDSFERAVDERVPVVATVLGSAGIGKTRLAAELAAAVDDQARLLLGRCLSYGEGITYWPLEEILRSLPGRPADTPDPHEGSTTEETFYAYRKLFEALAQEQPLVLVLEDVHWAEPTLLDLLEHVAGWTRDAPMLLLCLARPELLDERPGWPGERIELEPLRSDEAETIVSALAPGLGADARTRAADAAEGNPLFLEQLLSLAAEENGHELVVPPTIQALLAARLDRLPAEERAVIEPAAVVGKEFWRGAVVDLAPAGAEVSAVLQRLVRKEFIRPDLSTLPGEDAFRFAHQLIRDAAYAAIGKEARADMHEGLAGWLERNAAENEEIVAYHLERAYRYRVELGVPGEVEEELARRAAEHLESAGHRAYRRGDMGATANLLERTLALLPGGFGGRFELVYELASSFEQTGRLGEAEELLERAAGDAARLGRERDTAHLRTELAAMRFVHRGDSSIGELRDVALSVIPVFEAHDDDQGLASAWRLRGLEAWERCHYASAAEGMERALTHANRADDPMLVAEMRHWLMGAYYWGPTPVEEALARVQAILAEVDEESLERANGLTILGGLEAMRGDFVLARALYREGKAHLERLSDAMRIGGRSAVGGEIELLAECPQQAEAELRYGYNLLAEIGEAGLLSTVAASLAEAIVLQGRHDEAEKLSRLSEAATAPEDISAQIQWRSVRARAVLSRGDLDEADRLSAEAVTLAEPIDGLQMRGETFLRRGEVLAVMGRTEDARAAMEAGIRNFEAKGAVAAVPRVRRLLAQLPAAERPS